MHEDWKLWIRLEAHLLKKTTNCVIISNRPSCSLEGKASAISGSPMCKHTATIKTYFVVLKQNKISLRFALWETVKKVDAATVSGRFDSILLRTISTPLATSPWAIKTCHCYFCTSSVWHWPILIIFGAQHLASSLKYCCHTALWNAGYWVCCLPLAVALEEDNFSTCVFCRNVPSYFR